MCKFIVKSISVTNNFDFSINHASLHPHYPTCSFTLEIFPYGAFDDEVSKLLKSIHDGMVVGIDTDDYATWVNPFKDEFKEFLIEKYPEKIMADQQGFISFLENNMRVAIVGSRDFNDYKILSAVIDELRTIYNFSTIVSGGANGADSLAEKYAEDNNIEMKVFPAKWKELGKKAGYVRNIEIWDDSDMGVAFWDGKSRGTAHSFDISKRQNKKLYVFNYSTMDFYVLNENVESEFFSMKDNVKYKLNN